MIFAVIDTNVIVSSFITENDDAATARVIRAIADGKIIPLYNEEIIEEYRDVLSRPRFGFDIEAVLKTIDMIVLAGIDLESEHWPELLPDEDDRVFFEVALAGQDEDAKLVTGNIKHYPRVDFVVTPAQIMSLIS